MYRVVFESIFYLFLAFDAESFAFVVRWKRIFDGENKAVGSFGKLERMSRYVLFGKLARGCFQRKACVGAENKLVADFRGFYDFCGFAVGFYAENRVVRRKTHCVAIAAA